MSQRCVEGNARLVEKALRVRGWRLHLQRRWYCRAGSCTGSAPSISASRARQDIGAPDWTAAPMTGPLHPALERVSQRRRREWMLVGCWGHGMVVGGLQRARDGCLGLGAGWQGAAMNFPNTEVRCSDSVLAFWCNCRCFSCAASDFWPKYGYLGYFGGGGAGAEAPATGGGWCLHGLGTSRGGFWAVSGGFPCFGRRDHQRVYPPI